jgi:hypothetical protein
MLQESYAVERRHEDGLADRWTGEGVNGRDQGGPYIKVIYPNQAPAQRLGEA